MSFYNEWSSKTRVRGPQCGWCGTLKPWNTAMLLCRKWAVTLDPICTIWRSPGMYWERQFPNLGGPLEEVILPLGVGWENEPTGTISLPNFLLLTNFSKQKSTNTGDLTAYTTPISLCSVYAAFLEQVCLRTSTEDPYLRRLAETLYTHCIHWP